METCCERGKYRLKKLLFSRRRFIMDEPGDRNLRRCRHDGEEGSRIKRHALRCGCCNYAVGLLI